jgi:hypothetical protein
MIQISTKYVVVIMAHGSFLYYIFDVINVQVTDDCTTDCVYCSLQYIMLNLSMKLKYPSKHIQLSRLRDRAGFQTFVSYYFSRFDKT